MKDSVSPVISTAKYLWRNSLRWKWASLCAFAFTILAIIANTLPQQMQNTSLNQGNQPGGGQHPATQTPVQTGSTYTSSSTPSTTGPAQIGVVAAVDQKISNRLGEFYKVATAVETKTQAEGERCEGIVEATKVLQKDDQSYAQGGQITMLEKVNKCRPLLEDSNKHWAMVSEAGNAAAREHSLHVTRIFVDAVATLDAFDRSRSVAVRQQWLEKAQASKLALDGYEKDMAALESLSLLYRPNDPASIGTIDEIKVIYARLQTSPVSPKQEELNPAQKQALEIAQKVEKDLKESDRLLSALESAWQRRESDPTALAAMLAELSDVDRGRWDKEQGRPAKIEEMESTVGSLLPAVLDRLLAAYEKLRKREVAEQIIGLESMAKRLSVVIPSESLKRMDAVRGDLQASKHRIERVTKAAKAWNGRPTTGKDSSLEKEVLDAVAAVVTKPGSIEANPFDAAAMTVEEHRAFATLLSASVAIQGKLPQGQRPVGVSIFLDAGALSDPQVAPIAGFLRDQLKAAGFELVQQSGEAALCLVVSDAAISQKGTDENTGQKKFVVSLKSKMTLAYSGRKIDLGDTSAVAHSQEINDAIQAAEKAVAEHLAKVILIKLSE